MTNTQIQTVTIAGSASLAQKCIYQKDKRNNNGYEVIDYPIPINSKEFIHIYPEVHKKFYQNIIKTDIFFLMNENKNNIQGYIGAESFAELAFAVAQNLINQRNKKIYILQMPSTELQSYEDIILWLQLGWIELYNHDQI